MPTGADQLRELYDVLYGSTPATFESAYPLAESVQRLSDAVYEPLIQFGGGPRVVGNASERFVSIERVVPGARNSFRPVFTGAFHEVGGRIVLRGAYSLADSVKLFMSLWLGFCVVATVTMTFAVMDEGVLNVVPLFPLAMFAVGVVMVWNGRANTRRDMERIAEVIRAALA